MSTLRPSERAPDRLDRPPPGRLTAPQVELLALAARRPDEFDEPVSAPRAIAALAQGRAEVARPGTAPARLAGRLTSNGVELEVAVAAASRIRARSTESASVG